MKKRLLYALLASVLLVGCEKEYEESDLVFSVSPNQKVLFSSGNLEYSNGYSFASNQYDYGDFFGWGTGSAPMTTNVSSDYYVNFDDWGSHIDGGWRTLTADEWDYLLNKREGCKQKFGVAMVCNVLGIILLPDHWRGLVTLSGFSNNGTVSSYGSVAWKNMEKKGAVFLPAAGYEDRYGKNAVGEYGYYWTSTPYLQTTALTLTFSDYYFIFRNSERSQRQSVRLVKNV